MKKIFKKSNIFAFILGAIIFGSIGVVSAYTIFANDIGYTPKDTTWKKSNGEDITNVQDAIDILYDKSNISSDIKVLFENGEYYNQDKIQVVLANSTIISNQIQVSNLNYGVQTKGLDNKKHLIIYTITTNHPGYVQWGTCKNSASYPSIIEQGTDRIGFNTSNIASVENMPILVMESSANSGTFLGSYGGNISISKIEYLDVK